MRKKLIEKSKEPKIPSNLIECLEEMENMIDESEDLKALKNDDDIIAKVHHGLGVSIRNQWGMWDENSDLHIWFKEHGIWHADDMSGIVFESFVRKIKGEPIDFKGQVKFYQDFWEKQK